LKAAIVVDGQAELQALKFENWLIAGLAALKAMPARFQVTRQFERKVSPNKADNIKNAESALKRICKGASYHKGKDAREIARHQEPRRIAENSRSFRRFLRVVGCKKYTSQSREP
jgi:hypothetical protein